MAGTKSRKTACHSARKPAPAAASHIKSYTIERRQNTRGFNNGQRRSVPGHRGSYPKNHSFANSGLFCSPLLRRVRRLRAWSAANGHARAARTTVIPALIVRMVGSVTCWIATSGKFRNLHTGRILGKFVRSLPLGDFRSFESQLFVTQHVKLNPLGTCHLLHASVHI